MTFSIITIVKNAAEDLERTILSVINQDYDDYEYIIVDGGSEAKTQSVIFKYRRYFSRFVSESDNGLYYALNKGLKMASGKWISLMNAGDCFATNDALKQVSNRIDQTKSLVYSDLYLQKEDGELIQRKQPLPFSHGLYFSINHQSAFFNHEKLKEILWHDTRYAVAADTDLFFRIYAHDPKDFAVKIDEPLVTYKMGGFSAINYDLMILERENIVKKHIKDPIYRFYNVKYLRDRNASRSRLLRLYHRLVRNIKPVI